MQLDFVVASYFKDDDVNERIKECANGKINIGFKNLAVDTCNAREGNVFVLLYDDERYQKEIINLISDILSFKINSESLYVFIKKGVAIPIEWEFNPELILEKVEDWNGNDFFKKIKKIFDFYTEELTNQIEYEKLYEYNKIKSFTKVSLCVQKLINPILTRMDYYGLRYNVGSNYLRKISLLLEKMASHSSDDFSDESKFVAKNNLDLCKSVDGYIQKNLDIIMSREVHAAISILIYVSMEKIEIESRHIISSEKVDIVTDIDYQSKIEKLYSALEKKDARLPKELYFGDDQQTIKNVLSTKCNIEKYTHKTIEKCETEDDELLISIANFISEGNKVFSMISKKDNNEEFLQCLKTSYERLKGYCEIVGAKEIAEECIEKIYELKQMQIENTHPGETFEKADKGLKTLLGVKLPENGRFDAFISHKGKDIDIATDIYNLLRKNLKTAFLDKETLPELSNAEYINAIFDALDHSEHLIVVLSDVKYLKEKWLNYEMNTFLGEILDGRKKYGNIVFVVTRDVHTKLMEDKTLMPAQYRDYEIMLIEECDKEGKLISYIK